MHLTLLFQISDGSGILNPRRRRLNIDMSNIPDDQEYADQVFVDSANKTYWIAKWYLISLIEEDAVYITFINIHTIRAWRTNPLIHTYAIIDLVTVKSLTS